MIAPPCPFEHLRVIFSANAGTAWAINRIEPPKKALTILPLKLISSSQKTGKSRSPAYRRRAKGLDIRKQAILTIS
jgi:hypothetical protein